MFVVKMRSEPDLSGSEIEIFGHEQTFVATGAGAVARPGAAEVGALIAVGFTTVIDAGAEVAVLGRTEVDDTEAIVEVEGLGPATTDVEGLIAVDVEIFAAVGAGVVVFGWTEVDAEAIVDVEGLGDEVTAGTVAGL